VLIPVGETKKPDASDVADGGKYVKVGDT
jgi:hypothetical protein